MPDANGAFKGTGWTRSSAAAWERVFGRDECCYYGPPAEHPCDTACPRWIPTRPDVPDLMAALEASLSAVPVPTQPSREVPWTAADYDQRRSAFGPSD